MSTAAQDNWHKRREIRAFAERKLGNHIGDYAVRQAIHTGKLRPGLVIGGQKYYRESDIEAWLDSCVIEAESQAPQCV